MAKKKKPQAIQPKVFDRNPFDSLTGFAVSTNPAQPPLNVPPLCEKKLVEKSDDFAAEMALLEVQRLPNGAADEDESPDSLPPQQPRAAVAPDDAELFLQALGGMEVRFSDQFPEEDESPAASARRMKQLRQGKLSPQATLDLHGLTRDVVVEKIRFFLQDAQYQNWSTLLVITGRGLNSASGEPVLRQTAESFLASAEGTRLVAEWGRAPRKYGGDGALVLFLRKQAG